MREIKFRAWDKTTKSMFNVGEICWFGDGTRIDATLDRIDIQDREGFHQLGTDIELMQYTGLLDKQGKEIYEGDILQWWNKISNPQVVESTDGGWNPFIDDCTTDHPYHYEVIGNIYENPELLKGGRRCKN